MRFLNSIRYGLLSSIWPILSLLLVKVGGPKLAAYLTYLSINWGELKDTKTVLCLYRESFIKDIHELRIRGKFNYPVIMGGFTRFQMLWTVPEEQTQIFYQNYQAKNLIKNKDRDIYVEQLIRLINKKIHVDAILSANLDYWQDTPFKDYCKSQDIPFLVLSREPPVIPKICAEVIDSYKSTCFKFEGTAIAVAGKSTKQVLEKSDICPPEIVSITGLPRYDAWKDIDLTIQLKDRTFITLLSFTEGYYADNTFIDVLKIFISISNNHLSSNVDFLVKTKDINDTENIKKILQLNNLNAKKLIITHKYDLFMVLPLSKLVVNYNSLSLIEALMARTPIVIPAWGECKSNGDSVMYPENDPDISKVIKFAKKPNDILTYIESAIKGDLSLLVQKDSDCIIQKYIHISKDKNSYSCELENFFVKFGL
jgi:hypothetical protein